MYLLKKKKSEMQNTYWTINCIKFIYQLIDLWKIMEGTPIENYPYYPNNISP